MFYISSIYSLLHILFLFFFNDTATTEIYTLSLHDALPISIELIQRLSREQALTLLFTEHKMDVVFSVAERVSVRSEEHTSELQSPCNLVCRLLLEKKKKLRRQSSSWRFQKSRRCGCVVGES